MTRPQSINGPRIRLRPVVPDDAAYIYGLRIDPKYNLHLSSVTGTIEDQRMWIERYMDREAQRSEIYYVIERLSCDSPCGVVRLYGIKDDYFTWGSWILDENKPAKAALESAVLVYDIGFDYLNKSKAVFEVRRDNERTLEFHRRFGAIENGADETNIYFAYPREQFFSQRPRYLAMLKHGLKHE